MLDTSAVSTNTDESIDPIFETLSEEELQALDTARQILDSFVEKGARSKTDLASASFLLRNLVDIQISNEVRETTKIDYCFPNESQLIKTALYLKSINDTCVEANDLDKLTDLQRETMIAIAYLIIAEPKKELKLLATKEASRYFKRDVQGTEVAEAFYELRELGFLSRTTQFSTESMLTDLGRTALAKYIIDHEEDFNINISSYKL